MAAYPWLTPHFGVVATVVAGAFVAWFALVAPWHGRRRVRQLAILRRTDPLALTRFYRGRLRAQLLWLVVVLLALVTSSGLSGRDLGLRWPSGSHAAATWDWTVYLCAMLAISVPVLRWRIRRGGSVPGLRRIRVLLPVTLAERQIGLVVAVGAGVVEELVFRGFLTAAGVDLLGLGAPASVVVATVVFTAAHLYQGPAAIAVGLLSLALGALYLLSGSLLLPVIVHVALDVRAMVLLPLRVRSSRRPERVT